jgi:hypothetical protein
VTDLAAHIQRTPLVDTHEHLNPEEAYVNEGPDVLHDLFSIYIADDLHSAGASYEDVLRLFDSTDPDVSGRWHGVEKAWQRCRHTGYGEAVQNVARIVYGMPEISLKEIEAASETSRRLRQPGQRLRLLRDLANIDHVQIDDLEWGCRHEPADAEFFLHDMSWVTFCRGEIDFVALHSESGIEVTDLKSLRAAFAALFELHAPVAIAIKAQLPYYRTLEWNERADADAAPVLQKRLQGKPLTEEEQNCLGDWCWARGVELAVDHHLPFKLHTGYLAGCDQNIHHRRIRPGAIIPLVQRYPLARFVLMHIGCAGAGA